MWSPVQGLLGLMLLNFSMRMGTGESNLAGLVATNYETDEGIFDIAEYLYLLLT